MACMGWKRWRWRGSGGWVLCDDKSGRLIGIGAGGVVSAWATGEEEEGRQRSGEGGDR